MIIGLKKDQLKTAIADVLPVAKRVDKNLPSMRRARVVVRRNVLWLEATDRFIGLRSLIAPIAPGSAEDFEQFELSIESLDLLAKLSPMRIEVTSDGIKALSSSGNITCEKLDDDYCLPSIEKMIDEEWGQPWEKWGHDDGGVNPIGFDPHLIKHIKGVVVMPRKGSIAKPARILTMPVNRIEGIIMPARVMNMEVDLSCPIE